MICNFCMKEVKVYPKVNKMHLSLYCSECKTFIKHASPEERAKIEGIQKAREKAALAAKSKQTIITGQTVHETVASEAAVFKQVPTYADTFRKLSVEEIATMFGDVAIQAARLLKSQSLTPEQVRDQIKQTTLEMLKNTNQQ